MSIFNKWSVSQDANKFTQTCINDYFRIKISNNINSCDKENTVMAGTNRKMKKLGKVKTVRLPVPLLTYEDFLENEIKREVKIECEGTPNDEEYSTTLASSSKFHFNKTEVIEISSDDDFVSTPKKIKISKVSSTSSSSNISRKDKKERRKSKILNKSSMCDVSIASKCEAVLGITEIPSTSKESPSNHSTSKNGNDVSESIITRKEHQTFIGVNIPVKVATDREKKLPQLLSNKNETTFSCTPTNNKNSLDNKPDDTNSPAQKKKSINLLDIALVKTANQTPSQTSTKLKKNSPSQRRIKVKSPRKLFRSPNKETNSPKKTTYSPKKTLDTPKITDLKKLKANQSQIVVEEEIWNPLSLTIVKHIIDFVTSHNHLSSLLTCLEQDKLYQFVNTLDDRYKFFCFKLFTRLPKWYNILKFRDLIKMEMSDSDVKDMYNYLEETNFIVTDYSKESCVNLLHELSVKDLKDICNIFKLKAVGNKKGDLIQKLLKSCNRQSTLTSVTFEEVLKKEIANKMGLCVKLEPSMYQLLKKVHLLFSFVRYDLESISDLYLFLSRVHNEEIFMPQYSIDSTTVIFSSIEEFLSFSEALQCRKDIEFCFKERNYKQMLEMCDISHRILLMNTMNTKPYTKNPCFIRFTADYQYTSTLSFGVKHLGKSYPEQTEIYLMYLLQQDRYCQNLNGVWYDLLIMIRSKYRNQYEEAGEILLNAFKDPKIQTDIDLQMLSTRGESLKVSKAHPLPELLKNRISFEQSVLFDNCPCIEIDANVVPNKTEAGKRRYIERNGEEQTILTVEEVAINHYKRNGYKFGIHCEGGLFQILFYILFYDIIYDSSIPGAFIHQIQYFPLDLKTECFYNNRKKQIDQRLQEIKFGWREDQLRSFMSNTWDAHSHQSFININSFVDSIEDLCDIVICIGRLKLAHFLERIIKNHKRYHSGLPDLFLWTPEEKKCKFVEVKGEKDKLSFKQKVWLNTFKSAGADVEVCHVHTIGSNVRRKILGVEEAKKE